MMITICFEKKYGFTIENTQGGIKSQFNRAKHKTQSQR